MKHRCETCKHKGEICPSVSAYMGDCDGWEQKPITNADRIRAMTDEELAYFMANIEPCRESAWLDWLKQEINDEKYCE